MTRMLIPLILCAAAMPAAEGKGHPDLGAVLGSQALDPGHILEARAVPGQPGMVLIRWGDVANTIDKAEAKAAAMEWAGSVSGANVVLVNEVRFEDGSSHVKKTVVAGGKDERRQGGKPDSRGERKADGKADGKAEARAEARDERRAEHAAERAAEGKTVAKDRGPSDKIVESGGGTVTWDTHTFGAWDGIMVKATSGGTLQITSGPAAFKIVVP